MDEKKTKYRNCAEERTIELMKQYYEFDEDTKTFDIVLHYAKASDIFTESLDLLKKKVMKEEIVDKIANLLRDIPKGYKAEFSLVIDDYEGIPYEEILDSFNNALKIRFARFKQANNKKYFKVGLLITIGVFLVSLMIMGEVLGWWGGETIQGRLISYIIDTAGCVLIWEGLYSALLDRSPDATLAFMLSNRLDTIGFYKNDGSEDALLSENNKEVTVVGKEPRLKRIGNMALYIAGFALVVAGLISVMLRAPLFAESIKTSAVLTILLAVMEFVSATFLVGLGVLALLMRNENYRFFILTAILTILVSIFLGFSIISMFFSKAGPISIVTNVLSVVVMILFIIGFALSSFFHKKDIRRTVWGK